MYNRYIPQPDGTYRRNRVQEPLRPTQQRKPNVSPAVPKQAPCPPTPVQNHCTPPRKEPHHCDKPSSHPPEISIPSFLKQLLPQGLDTGDLLVIILLLLMAGDCREDQNHALLTLMLYLFL